MNSPFFSVIIPTYNRLELICEAVESVLAQTYENWELIIADDGSTDNTRLRLEEFQARDSRVKILLLAHDGHPGTPRNRAAEISTGPWLAFLDSDDLWTPEKLARQAAFLEARPETNLLHCREVWRRGDRIVSQKGQKHRRSGDVFSDALWKCTIGPSTTVVRRDLFLSFGGFRETLEVAEDYELWLRICAEHDVEYLDEPLVIKRAGAWEQLSEKYGQIEGFRIAALESLLESGVFSSERHREAAEILCRKARIYAQGAAKRGRVEDSEKFTALADKWERK